MTYTVHGVRIINTNPKDFFVVEEAVLCGGYWTYANDARTLIMNGSGTSGALRLRGEDGEEFLVPLGAHNYKRWCDSVTDLTPDDSAVRIQPEYYGGARGGMLWKQLAEISKKSSKGTQIDVKYTSEKDTVFKVHITIA